MRKILYNSYVKNLARLTEGEHLVFHQHQVVEFYFNQAQATWLCFLTVLVGAACNDTATSEHRARRKRTAVD